MLTVSCLLVSCTKEKLVMRDHDVSAEVGQLVTTEHKALFCNLNDVENLDITSALEYLNDQMNNGVGMALILAPKANVADIEAFCATNEYNCVSSCDTKIAAYAISKEAVSEYTELHDVITGCNALFISYNSVYYVLSALVSGDGEAECQLRTEQLNYIIAQTMDKEEYPGNGSWVFALDMNALAQIDKDKYGRPYTDVEYDPAVGPTVPLYSWQFASHSVLLTNNLTDCVAAQFNNYPYAAMELRHNFLYASPLAWMAMLPLEIDKGASYLKAGASLKQEDEGDIDEGEGDGEGDDNGEGDDDIVIPPTVSGKAENYPIIFTLKSEER